MKRRVLERCLREARAANDTIEWVSAMRHFSFVVQGPLVMMGVNRHGPAPLGFGYGGDGRTPSIHAEPDAYRKASKRIDFSKPWDVVNIRLNRAGDVRISAPCPCCTAFLSAMGCREVHFTTGSGWARMRLS